MLTKPPVPYDLCFIVLLKCEGTFNQEKAVIVKSWRTFVCSSSGHISMYDECWVVSLLPPSLSNYAASQADGAEPSHITANIMAIIISYLIAAIQSTLLDVTTYHIPYQTLFHDHLKFVYEVFSAKMWKVMWWLKTLCCCSKSVFLKT